MTKKLIAIFLVLTFIVGAAASAVSCSCELPSPPRYVLTIDGGFAFDSRAHYDSWDWEGEELPNNVGILMRNTIVYIVAEDQRRSPYDTVTWYKNGQSTNYSQSFSFTMPAYYVTFRAQWEFYGYYDPIYETCETYPCECPFLSDGVWDGRRSIIDRPYTPRHNGAVENREFFELPVLRGGLFALGRVNFVNQAREQVSFDIIDCYDFLSSLRLGFIDNSRPIIHEYSREFFEEYVLLLAIVSGPCCNTPQDMKFETLVTCSQYIYPVFRFDASEGQSDFCLEEGLTYLLEIPRALLVHYQLGSAMSLNSNGGIYVWTNNYEEPARPPYVGGEQLIEWTINRLPCLYKIYCGKLFGLHRGEDDSVWIEAGYGIRMDYAGFSLDGLPNNTRRRIYIVHEEPVWVGWGWGRSEGLMEFVRLPLRAGNNTILIKNHWTVFRNGVDERTFAYATIYVDEEVGVLSYVFSVDSAVFSVDYQVIRWTANYRLDTEYFFGDRVYLKQANTSEYLFRSNTWSRSLGVENIGVDMLMGVNTIIVANFRYYDGVVRRHEARWDIERVEDTVVEYEFSVSVNSVRWNGAGRYFVYVRQSREDDFSMIHHSVEAGASLQRLNFNEGYNEMLVTQMRYVNGVFTLRRAYFEFYYRVKDISDEVEFWVSDDEYLLWWWEEQEITVRFIRVYRWEEDRGGFLLFRTIETYSNRILWQSSFACEQMKGATLRVRFGWSLTDGVMTRYIAYWDVVLD